MSPTIFDCIAGSRTHTRTHDSWVSQCNFVCLLVPYHVRTDVFFEQGQVRLAATVTSFYTRKPTQGRLLCLIVT